MTPRKISCPRCDKPSLFTAENPYRPFCSERCKLIDLGNWADGRYALPAGEAGGSDEEETPDEARDEKMSVKHPDDGTDIGTQSDFDDDDRHRH